MIVVVMGVSGSGKTTVGVLLARRLNWSFAEGDEFHPPRNIAKMQSGVPLDDEDRRPWLDAIAARIDRWRAEGEDGVIVCSALKGRYRDVIIGDRDDVRLVYLRGERSLILRRLADRQDHFMPPELLDSQFEALEEPTPDEDAIEIGVEASPPEIVDAIVKALESG